MFCLHLDLFLLLFIYFSLCIQHSLISVRSNFFRKKITVANRIQGLTHWHSAEPLTFTVFIDVGLLGGDSPATHMVWFLTLPSLWSSLTSRKFSISNFQLKDSHLYKGSFVSSLPITGTEYLNSFMATSASNIECCSSFSVVCMLLMLILQKIMDYFCVIVSVLLRLIASHTV